MHDMSVTIRRYEPSDREGLRVLHNTVMTAVGANYGPGPWNVDLDTIPETYLNGRGDFVVGEAGGRLVAMGGVHELDQDRCAIRRMRILPSMQRCGLGQKILERLEDSANALGYAVIELDTLLCLTGAQAFYEKNGYSHYRTSMFQDEPQLLYRKMISRE